jgi:hypothetical protein
MFDRFFKQLEYEEYIGISVTGQPTYANKKLIDGLRLKGQVKVVTSEEGDSTSCNIVYKTKQKIIPLSKINGRTVMECVPVNALWVSEDKAGYLSYVK